MQLEFWILYSHKNPCQYFNPTLVQLECAMVTFRLPKEPFQSHIGAIRMKYVIENVIQVLFNPTLVQLEFNFGGEWSIVFFLFQSHIGAIRIGFLAERFINIWHISIPHWCN